MHRAGYLGEQSGLGPQAAYLQFFSVGDVLAWARVWKGLLEGWASSLEKEFRCLLFTGNTQAGVTAPPAGKGKRVPTFQTFWKTFSDVLTREEIFPAAAYHSA